MEDLPRENAEETGRVQNPDRRKLLKLLAAGGAVTAASMLPGKWTSPVVKSGVLPAHAQVTQQEYEVRCANWDWQFIEDEIAQYSFNGSATAMDITNNVPLANVSLTATATIATGVTRSTTATTNASGVANFAILANVNDVQLTTIEVTVSFTDAQYGNDTCTAQIQLREPA